MGILSQDKYWIWAYYPRTNTGYGHIIPGQILDMGIFSQDKYWIWVYYPRTNTGYGHGKKNILRYLVDHRSSGR
jgi:hypothetical protein